MSAMRTLIRIMTGTLQTFYMPVLITYLIMTELFRVISSDSEDSRSTPPTPSHIFSMTKLMRISSSHPIQNIWQTRTFVTQSLNPLRKIWRGRSAANLSNLVQVFTLEVLNILRIPLSWVTFVSSHGSWQDWLSLRTLRERSNLSRTSMRTSETVTKSSPKSSQIINWSDSGNWLRKLRRLPYHNVAIVGDLRHTSVMTS